MNINPLYALPNFFTAGSIFCGIVSIMLASNSLFEQAAWLIVVSMIFDGLDGRVARLTNTQSKFGVEFDSLADIVAFGVAPAMLVYYYLPTTGANYGLEGIYGLYRVFVCALFVIFGAIRLARFNITTSNAEPNTFIGLPIPSAAVIVVLWILVDLRYNLLSPHYGYALLIVAFVVSILMVSNIRYPSFKKIAWNLKAFIIALIAIAAIISSKFYVEVLCALMSAYLLYGIGRWGFLLGKMMIKKV